VKTFERYLTLFVLAAMALGVLLGQLTPKALQAVADFEVAHINLPIAVFVWLMIYPMMLQIDCRQLGRLKQHRRGLALTLTMNWVIKPFTMAALAWLFFHQLFAPWLSAEQSEQYLAGAILLGAAPCTAMVFVWSYLTRGDANYTLVQVAVNDLVLLAAYIPLVQLLLGVTGAPLPFDTLLTAVLLFVALPLAAGMLTQKLLQTGPQAEQRMVRLQGQLRPFAIGALLATLVLLFALQADSLLTHPGHILLIAVPLTLQTYLVFGATWLLGKRLKLPVSTCAPSAFIGASNFFELAVAVAITLYGLDSGAALATVVGVLIEVPVMLSLVAVVNRRWGKA